MPAPHDDSARPAYERIARHVRNDIEAGVLREGQTLPSTRELARRWDVSSYTAAKAMSTLTEEGVIQSVPGSGRVVGHSAKARAGAVNLETPQLILVGGYAGSGKSELGRILARQTGWPVIDKDTITRPVVELALEVLGQPGHDRDSQIYMEQVRPREYDALMAAAAENLACGVSTIVTAPFLRELRDETWLARAAARFSASSATMHLVWLRCDPETMHTYLRHRGAARDAAKLASWDRYSEELDPDYAPARPHTIVDNSATSAPLQDQATRLVEQIVANEEAKK